MRAWTLEGPDAAAALREVDDPDLGPWDVRVELRASALNHLDLWVAQGMPAPPGYPHVVGADGAGVILEIGQAVENVRIGTEVVIDPSVGCGRCRDCLAGDVPYCRRFQVVGEHRWGTHAEHVVVPATNVVAKPEAMTWEEAGSFGLVTASAVRMLRRAGLAEGEDVLVVGVGGGSATAAFLVAQALGARVWATSRSAEAQAWALEHDAAGSFDTEGGFDAEIREATSGRGVDIVVDNVGAITFERSLGSLARGGRLVTNGSTSGRTAEVHLPTLFWRQLQIVGASMNDRTEFAEAAGLGVTVPVAATFGFDDYPAALERLRQGGGIGKIVLTR
jgi:NADPH:quinone reductase-like Zn-dependent oxidoreductase